MIKSYFKSNCINIKSFAKLHNLDYVTLIKIINGTLTGERMRAGNTKKVFKKLYELGIISEKPRCLEEVSA